MNSDSIIANLDRTSFLKDSDDDFTSFGIETVNEFKLYKLKSRKLNLETVSISNFTLYY